MPRERGFTLIEVVIALSLGAMVVLIAHRLFTGVADGAARVTAARQGLDRQMNARRWIAEAFGSLAVGDRDGPFEGRPDRVDFGSWQLEAHGWQHRERLTLRRRGATLLATLGAEREIVLADSVQDVAFDYLLESGEAAAEDPTSGRPGEQARFVREWLSPATAPAATRMRITYATGQADTLLLLIGPRG